MSAQHRRDLLGEAAEMVAKQRNVAYEEPEDSFRNIAALWDAYLKAKLDPTITSADVAQMMILLKVARLTNNPSHHDSAIDIAGYAACLADIAAAVEQHPTLFAVTAGTRL